METINNNTPNPLELPQEVKQIIFSIDQNESLYHSAIKIQERLNCIGWTCNFDLSGQIFDVQPINVDETN